MRNTLIVELETHVMEMSVDLLAEQIKIAWLMKGVFEELVEQFATQILPVVKALFVRIEFVKWVAEPTIHVQMN